MRRLVVSTAAILVFAAPAAHARPGDLDRSFGDGGRVADWVFGFGGYTAGLALPDGLRPLMSVGTGREGKPVPGWMRLTTLGRIANRIEIPAPAIRAPLLASGYSLTRIAVEPFAPRQYQLARIGSADAVTLTVPDPALEVSGFGIDGSGRAVLVGYGGGNLGVQAVRFLVTGQLDSSYAGGGVARLDSLVGEPMLVVRRDGRVYVAAGNGVQVVGLDGAGRRFAQVDVPAPRSSEFLSSWAFVEGPGQTLLIAGSTGSSRPWIARLNADGRLDRRFAGAGIVVVGGRGLRSSIHAVARDRRGRLVAVGTRRSQRARSSASFFRFSARGRIDRSFGERGMAFKRLGDVTAATIVGASADHVAIDDRGRIVVAGQSYDNELMSRDDQGQAYPAIARLKG